MSRHALRLRTNRGCTALLVLSGDQTVVEVRNVNTGKIVKRDNSYGFRPLSCSTCRELSRPCSLHHSARPWLPLSLASAARAAAARGATVDVDQ